MAIMQFISKAAKLFGAPGGDLYISCLSIPPSLNGTTWGCGTGPGSILHHSNSYFQVFFTSIWISPIFNWMKKVVWAECKRHLKWVSLVLSGLIISRIETSLRKVCHHFWRNTQCVRELDWVSFQNEDILLHGPLIPYLPLEDQHSILPQNRTVVLPGFNYS